MNDASLILGAAFALLCACSGGAGGVGGAAEAGIGVEAGVDSGTVDALSGDGVADTSINETGVVLDGTLEGGPGCPSMQYGPNQCNVPTQCGPIVQTTQLSQTPPAPLGGTIAPGVYYLTQFNIYDNGPPLKPFTKQLTSSVTANTFAVNSYTGGVQETPISGTYTTSGTTLIRTWTCPSAFAPESHPYTATATTLILYETGGTPYTSELIETKQ